MGGGFLLYYSFFLTMYYEGRIYVLHAVRDAHEAAQLMFGRELEWYKVPVWELESGHKMMLVADGHLDSMFDEVAVIRQEGDRMYQVESITLGWIKSADYFEELILPCEAPNFRGDDPIKRQVVLSIGEPRIDTIAGMMCGCCGAWFKGVVRDQLAFGQDAGYGFCDECSEMYY